MKAGDLNFSQIDSYIRLLSNLSPDNKLELISRLSDSLKGFKQPTGRTLNELYGAFISKESADEIIIALKNNRNFNRNTEEL